MNKRFVAADDLLKDSFQLAADIAASDFRPDFVVGLWRGGSAVGIAVQEGLEFLGIETDHIAIRTSYRGALSYNEMVSKADAIRVHGLQYLLENLCAHHALLIVDDVYSTGSSVKAVIDQLTQKTRRNLPHDIRIATVWYRPTQNTQRVPDYFIHETADWLALPYELNGMSLRELRENRPELDDIVDRLEALVGSEDLEAT
jgi:hypoxanthine phosphoribosyltransferase